MFLFPSVESIGLIFHAFTTLHACIIIIRSRLISLMDIKQLFWFFISTAPCLFTLLFTLTHSMSPAPLNGRWKCSHSAKNHHHSLLLSLWLCIVPTHLFSGERTNVKAKRQWQFFTSEDEYEEEEETKAFSFTFIHSRVSERRERRRRWTCGDFTQNWKFN